MQVRELASLDIVELDLCGGARSVGILLCLREADAAKKPELCAVEDEAEAEG